MKRLVLMLVATWLLFACDHGAGRVASSSTAGSNGMSAAGTVGTSGTSAGFAGHSAGVSGGKTGAAGRSADAGVDSGASRVNTGEGGNGGGSAGATGGSGTGGQHAGGSGASAGAGGASAGSGGGTSTSCPGVAACTGTQVCVASRRVGGGLVFPDAGACPTGAHLESRGSADTYCAADYAYQCATLVGCDKSHVSCTCANPGTCPTPATACHDPQPSTASLDPLAQLICEQQVP